MKRIGTKVILGNKFIALLFLLGCFGCGEKHSELKQSASSSSVQPGSAVPAADSISLRFAANKAKELPAYIICMYEDQQENMWYGTNAGLFRYKGTELLHFTRTDGLVQNQIQQIQQDAAGNFWITTGGFGINKFDGKSFRTYAVKSENSNWWPGNLTALCFRAGAGARFLQNDSLVYYPFPFIDFSSKTKTKYNALSAVAVYSTLKDSKNNLWFGTQAAGVCKFEGKDFKWFTEKNLSGPAVLALAEDKQGNIWMGTNGSGLFCYDGKTLLNYTDEHELGNKAFRINGSSNSNSLARITALQTDNSGVLFIGTADAGLWRIENKQIKHMAAVETFENKGIECIYCDKKGQIFIGTNGAGLFRWDGNFVSKVTLSGIQ